MNAGTPVCMEGAVSRTWEDVRNLEAQIRNLLQTMEMGNKIEKVPIVSLPEQNDGRFNAQVRMGWSGAENAVRKPKKGKSFVETGKENFDEFMDDLLALDQMEVKIREETEKYKLNEDSIFFVPVLDKCVFGMTLINLANEKLNTPTVSVSLFRSSSKGSDGDEGSEFQRISPFLYNVNVHRKEFNLNKTAKIDSADIPFQDSFLYCNGEPGLGYVSPGCEVCISVNFQYPNGLLEGQDKFTLLVSILLDGLQLWSRRIDVDGTNFGAKSIDYTFGKHRCDILNGIGEFQQSFKVERILTYDEKTLKKSIENFLVPLGFECILSERSCVDKHLDIYTSNQPSMFWGSQFKLETCSRTPSLVRYLVSARSEDQMKLIFHKFKSWLTNEVKRERRYGTGKGPKVSSILPRPAITIINKVESEIELILKLHDAKTVLNYERKVGKSQTRKGSQFDNVGGSIDSNWIYEYSSCVTKTDKIFMEKVGE